MSEVTRILDSLGTGESESAAELLPLVYGELRQLAAAKMASERAGHTLQATALVHEVWIKLVGAEGGSLEWNGRRHFYAAAAEAMRRILIDHARRKLATRRGGEWLEITFGDFQAPQSVRADEMIDLNDALDRLNNDDPEKAEVAKLRLFGGLTVPEIALALGASESTIKRRWTFANAWLSRELKDGKTKTDSS
ncbi:MAG: RNA polymerase sigma factor (TIGR02999 family) [Verrucomicrobiales bacterium]|jgi:RNA polymerase sigma factor (TIGR02999 family)